MIISIFLSTLVIFLVLYGRVDTIWIAVFAAVFDTLYFFILRQRNHNDGLLEIDICANKSPLRYWNSTIKLIFSLGMLSISIFTKHVEIAVYIFIILSTVTITFGKVHFKDYVRLLSVPLNFAMISLISVLLSFSHNPDGTLNVLLWNIHIVVMPSSQTHAIELMARILGALSCLYMVSLTTPIGEIIYVLKKLKLPGIVTDLMYLIYRYIFVLLKTFREMNNAAESRLGYNGYKAGIKTILIIAGNLFFISLRKASDSFNAMESRLYSVGNIRFLSSRNKIDAVEWVTYILIFVPIILYRIWSSL